MLKFNAVHRVFFLLKNIMATFETSPYKTIITYYNIRKRLPQKLSFFEKNLLKMDSFRKPSANKRRVDENEIKTIRLKFDGIIGLREVILNELQSLYYVEKALLKAFPKMIKNACSFELIEAITLHFEETKQQVIRLEDAFLALNENPKLLRCQAIEQLINDVDLLKTVKSIIDYGLKNSATIEQDLVVPEWHKEIVLERRKNAKREDYIDWNTMMQKLEKIG